MVDPLSVASGIAGLLSLGIQVTQSLVNFYTAYKHQDADVAKITHNIENLQALFRALDVAVEERRSRPDTKDLLREVDKAVQKCAEVITDLQNECDRFHKDSAAGFKDRVKTVGRRAAYPFRKGTLSQLEEDVGVIRENLSFAMSILQLKSHTMIQHDISDIKSIVERINASQVSFAIRSWLKAPDAFLNHNANCAKCHPSTGLWFVNGHKFQDWLKEENSFLWLNGFAGCGKSVLCSTAIQYSFHHMQQKDGAVGIAFFYFSFSDEQKQDDNGMLRTLLLQLSGQLGRDGERDLEQLQELYRSGSPPVNVLLDLLQHQLKEFSNAYILIDALDESPRDLKREGVLRAIEAIRGWSIPGLHFLVTSRNQLDIRESLNPLPVQNILLRNSEVDEDIESFVSHQLENDRKLQKWKVRHTEIKERLTAGAQGVFRYVECQFNAFRRVRNRNQLDECLRSLPRDLDETYERILCSIPHEYVDDVHRVLTLLCFSARPLTIYELIDAHAVDLLNEPPRLDRDGRSYEQHDLVDICLGLVEVVVTKDASAKKEQTLIARIAHFSVQEYLQSERILQQGSKSFAMQSAPANKEIAHICLVYLLEPSLSAGIFDVANTSLHFAHFAARHWFDHYAGSEEGQADVEPLVLELLAENRAAFVTWIKLHDMDQTLNMKKKNRLYTGPESAIAESLYYAALLGLEFVIHSLLKCDIEDTRKASDAINTHLGFCGNALQAASANGHEKVVKLLLDKGANINAQGGVYGNSLQAASANGHEKVVKLLLDKHAYINIRGGQYHSALQAALVRNHKRVVQLLLDKGANTNAQGGYYGSALQTAVIHCDEEVVQLLLDKGANVNTQAGHSGNALQAASVTGKIVLLQMLLDKGANINAQGGNHGNALQAALARGHRSAVQLLLDKGANIHAQGGVYGNILQAAAFNADEKVVQMLLDKGANINAQCGAYGNALQAASATGNAILLQMMLDKGANINAQGGFYGNALEAALKNGHKILVQKLVEGGADLDFKDSKNGRTSLVRMVIGGYPVINKPSLWINKVGLDVKDNCGRGPFFYAAWYGYATFVGAILTADDVDPDRKDHYGLTPLSVAVRHGHTEIVKMLLATGSVTCDSRDCFGRSVSWWAKRMGNPDVQELLADHSKIRGIPIFDENFDEWSAPNHPIRRCCDSCTLDISKDTVYYRCNICDGGDFDVCITCYELEGRCLQDGHYMFRKGNDGVLD